MDCLTCLVKNAAIYQNYVEFRLIQKPEEKKNKTKALTIDTVRVLCDIPVALSFVKPGSVNGKTAGLLGTLTSIIGIYQMWN